MRSLLIISYNRPKHLYVTLESIFGIKNLTDWDVAVSLDYQEDENIDVETDEMLAYFPVDRIYRSCRHKGILDNLTDSLSYEFSAGSEEVIFLEDDFIVRSDTLQYVDNVGREEFMIALSGDEYGVVVHYRPRGNLITRKNFAELCEWIKSRKYIGLESGLTPGYFFTMKDTGHDAIFSRFVNKYAKMIRFPSEFYVAHFGISGIHLSLPPYAEEARIAELEIFSGDRSKWLENVLSAFKNTQYSPRIQSRLWPKEFEYK